MGSNGKENIHDSLCSRCRPMLETVLELEDRECAFTVQCDAMLRSSRSCLVCFRIVLDIANSLGSGGQWCRLGWNPSVDEPELATAFVERVGKTITLEVLCSWIQHLSVRVLRENRSEFALVCFDVEEFVSAELADSRRPLSAPDSKVDPRFDLHVSQLARIRTWLNQCSQYHSFCPREEGQAKRFGRLLLRKLRPTNKNGKRFRPTRLIEVGKDKTNTRLIVTSSLNDYKYATLSHCWGRRMFETLQQHNYQEHLEHIPESHLTKTFIEAITLCRLLGINYIWIDSWCIVQNSAEDFEVELDIMDQIYANAFVNLAAPSSLNGGGGLFRPVNHIATGVAHVNARTRIRDSKIHHDMFAHCPLFQRGWVVQEMALSPRTIHFTDTSVHWQCREFHTAGDVGPRQGAIRPKLHLDGLYNVNALDKAWLDIASSFAKTRVTHEEDRALALAPLATRFARRYASMNCPTTYIAGSWTHNMLLFLCWSVPKPHPKNSHSSVAPSWSWLSTPEGMDGVSFELQRNLDYWASWYVSADNPKLLSSEVEPKVASLHMGPLHHGFLLVNAAWGHARSSWETSPGDQSGPGLVAPSEYQNNKMEHHDFSMETKMTKFYGTKAKLEVTWDKQWWGASRSSDEGRAFILLVLAQGRVERLRGIICTIADKGIGKEDGIRVVERCGTFDSGTNTSKAWHYLDSGRAWFEEVRPPKKFWLV